MAQAPLIELKPNGPLLVKGLEILLNSKGERLGTEDVIALCRCGRSGNKPFCDGTHKKVGFSDERLSDGSADKLENYRGKKITIHDNRAICAHAGHCRLTGLVGGTPGGQRVLLRRLRRVPGLFGGGTGLLGLAAGRHYGVPMPVTATARELVQAMIGNGYGDKDFAALLSQEARAAGIEIAAENVDVGDGLS